MAYQIEQPMQVKLLPAHAGWWILPLWTTLVSVWTFSRSALAESPADIAVAAVLVVAGWHPFWRAATQTAWAEPLGQWKTWTETAPIAGWPYLESGTPGALLHRQLAEARSWWQKSGRNACRQPLRHGLLGLLVSLLLAAALGRDVLLLSIAFVTVTELAALWHEGKGRVGTLWSAIALVGLPWLLGGTLAGDGLQGAGAALVVALTAALYAQPAWWAILGPALAGAFLVWQGHPLTAGWLLLSALPGLIVLAENPEDDVYRSLAGWSVLAMVTLVAAVL